ncbi:hypothetical protein VP01_145g2 [Puccinia sorghi]|uniref:Uncharacterized protein n=1 Tax=Puccinia sorghi TaxID=27349 RepID=A0A0L6VK09_9BASI|nr:hypothetical protein VP01_145g2 [Puccinia sorghi]
MTQHYQLHLDTPIYSSTFINPTTIIIGAGGGTTKSGITNKITIINITTKHENQLNLQKGDDVPMSMHYDPLNNLLICGINSTETPEKNTHLRTFLLDKNQSQLKLKSVQTLLTYQSNDDYQRITCLSPQAPKLLAIGGTNNQLELLNYPTLKPAFKTLWCEQQLYAVDFHSDGSQGKLTHPHLIREIERPTTETNCTFRNAMYAPSLPPQKKEKRNTLTFFLICIRYGRGMNSSMLYTILNHLPSRGSSVWGGKDQRKAQLISWKLGSGDRERCKLISSKPVTCFDVSASGRLVAFSSSDLSIGILDGASLRSLLSILHAHEFPVTSLKFSPDDSRVVSCSADMTMRVIELDGSILVC